MNLSVLQYFEEFCFLVPQTTNVELQEVEGTLLLFGDVICFLLTPGASPCWFGTVSLCVTGSRLVAQGSPVIALPGADLVWRGDVRARMRFSILFHGIEDWGCLWTACPPWEETMLLRTGGHKGFHEQRTKLLCDCVAPVGFTLPIPRHH